MRFPILLVLLVLTAAGCRPSIDSEARAAGSSDVRTVNATTAPVVEKPISRFVSATGTLTAEEQADVSAEVAGRVVATPVERGTLVSEGAELIRISDAEVRAQVQEAEANAAQIQARLAFSGDASFNIDRVPEGNTSFRFAWGHAVFGCDEQRCARAARKSRHLLSHR